MDYDNGLAALADPTRRSIFERLLEGSASVGELAESVPVSQPAVSQHLKVLRQARLVSVEKRGTRHIYSVDPEGVGGIRRYVESLWEDVLCAFETYAADGGSEG